MTIGNGVLGYKVKDLISGFEGTAVGHVVYLSGCNQVLVTPPYNKKELKWPDACWIDEQRIQVVGGKTKKRVVLDNSKTSGHDVAPPTS